MRIVIVGAGKLGYSIAELLSKEEYDVIVVDKDEQRLEVIKDSLDVLTMAANGSSPITLGDGDIRGAEVLIAVTNSDEVNMISCILAKKNGIKHTIARIRDIQFISEAKEYLKENIDIDLMLNPEMITALEINRILMVPAALNVEDFADGKVRLFEAKVRTDSKLANIPFRDLNMPREILAAMLFRAHEMIIPHGNDSLQPMDNAYFIGRTKDIENFSHNFVQQDSSKIERVMIIGAGRTGRFLATVLDRQGVKVKIFDKDRNICREMAEKLKNGEAYEGDGTDIDLLVQEGIKEADAVACLTKDDKLNLLVAMLCKHLGAKKTIVQVSRSEYIDIMEKVGIDIVLSSRMLASSEVLAYVRRGGIISVSLLEGAKVEAIEVIVQDNAQVAGKQLKQAGLPRECLVCAYLRNDEANIANGSTVLQAGDRVIIIIKTSHSKRVLEYFKNN